MSKRLLDHRQDVGLARGANLLGHRLAVLEEQQRRQASTLNARAVAALWSMLTATTLILPSCSAAISSSIGFIALQGPHQSAFVRLYLQAYFGAFA